jgi:uncharacterized protein (TIRG00374 family)
MTLSSQHWLRQPSVWVGLIISLVSIVALVSQIDIADLLDKLRQADVGAVLAGLTVFSLSPFIRGVRWRAILGWQVGVWKAFHADNIGYLLNAVLPLRAGEPGRAYVISRLQPGLSPLEALSTVVVTRLVDMIAVIVLLGLVLPALDVPDLVKAGSYSLLLMVAVAVAVLIVGAYARARLLALLSAVLGRVLPAALAVRLVAWADDFLRGLSVLRSPRRLLWLGMTTAALWLCYLAFYHLVLTAFWPAPPLAWTVLGACAASLSMVVPSSPANVGVFHAAVAFALTPYLTADRAVAYAIVAHAAELLMTVLFGVYGLAATGTSLLRVNAAAAELSRPALVEQPE